MTTTKTRLGIACPRCGGTKLRTYRTVPKLGAVERWRDCRKCGLRFKTSEAAAENATGSAPLVIAVTSLLQALESDPRTRKAVVQLRP